MMQRFRKIGAVRASLQITAGLKKSANVAKFSTWMTDTVGVVQEKPRDDGFKYYKSAKDIEREKIMDAEFERILNSYATSEDKQKLIQLLDPLPFEQRSWRERNCFYDWRFALPTCGYLIMPFMAQEFIPLNLYMNLEILFLYNSWLWYSFFAYRMGPVFDEGIHEILIEAQKHDLEIIDNFNDNIAENEVLINWEGDVTEVLAISDELTTAQVDVFNSIEGHAFRDSVAQKLDALVTLEMAAQQSIRMRMVTSVKDEVKNLFLTNKTAKENAMNQAIAILTAGPSAKMGKDVVGEAYGVAVKNYQESYSKLPAGTDDILLNLEKEMAAIAVPITFEAVGGNVFETNPIRA